jgi:hypothetical protein
MDADDYLNENDSDYWDGVTVTQHNKILLGLLHNSIVDALSNVKDTLLSNHCRSITGESLVRLALDRPELHSGVVEILSRRAIQ